MEGPVAGVCWAPFARDLSEVERGLRDLPLSTLARIVEVGLGATLVDVLPGPSGVLRLQEPAEPELSTAERGRVDAIMRKLRTHEAADRRAVLDAFDRVVALARR